MYIDRSYKVKNVCFLLTENIFQRNVLSCVNYWAYTSETCNPNVRNVLKSQLEKLDLTIVLKFGMLNLP